MLLEGEERGNIATINTWMGKNQKVSDKDKETQGEKMEHFEQLKNETEKMRKQITMIHCYRQGKLNNRRCKEIEVDNSILGNNLRAFTSYHGL
jgi:hypothetical protein